MNAPILLFHGTEDRVTDIEQGRALFELFPASHKKKIEVKGAGHLEFEYDFLIKEIVNFIAANPN